MKFVGIDPGTKNLGIAIIDENNTLCYSAKMAMDQSRDVAYFVKDVIRELGNATLDELNHVSIERYVSYGMPMSKVSEQITMIIGGLLYHFHLHEVQTALYRAIEWKPALCKHLVKKYGFDNPSTSFDKKFDLAAAKCITGSDLPTDHEADAVCLAYMRYVK